MNIGIMQISTVAFCAFAALTDIITWKIPNLLIYSFAAAGVIYRLCTEGFNAAGDIALSSVIVLLVLGWTFYFRMMGAGDIKLIITVGIWTGKEKFPAVMFCSFAIAALIAVIKLIINRNHSKRRIFFMTRMSLFLKSGIKTDYINETDKKYRMHLGVPVFAGVLLNALGVFG